MDSGGKTSKSLRETWYQVFDSDSGNFIAQFSSFETNLDELTRLFTKEDGFIVSEASLELDDSAAWPDDEQEGE